MRRAVGAVVVIGMICLGGILSDWTLRFQPAAPDSLSVRLPDSLPSFAARKISPLPRTKRASSEPPPAFVLDALAFLSRAPLDSLDLLPGIGPVLAGRIIEARRAHDGFTSWDDVLAVKGIGPRLIARWRALAARQ